MHERGVKARKLRGGVRLGTLSRAQRGEQSELRPLSAAFPGEARMARAQPGYFTPLSFPGGGLARGVFRPVRDFFRGLWLLDSRRGGLLLPFQRWTGELTPVCTCGNTFCV